MARSSWAAAWGVVFVSLTALTGCSRGADKKEPGSVSEDTRPGTRELRESPIRDASDPENEASRQAPAKTDAGVSYRGLHAANLLHQRLYRLCIGRRLFLHYRGALGPRKLRGLEPMRYSHEWAVWPYHERARILGTESGKPIQTLEELFAPPVFRFRLGRFAEDDSVVMLTVGDEKITVQIYHIAGGRQPDEHLPELGMSARDFVGMAAGEASADDALVRYSSHLKGTSRNAVRNGERASKATGDD
jgi:hypothetical protein